MVNASKITNYCRSTNQLEEFFLFSIGVAAANAPVTARSLERLLRHGKDLYSKKKVARKSKPTPFSLIRYMNEYYKDIGPVLGAHGFRCWGMKSRGFVEAAYSGIDLRKDSTDELEKIHGVAQKTSRFFTMHSRKGMRVACLDTHVLQWMRDFTTFDVPDQTPKGKKYLELQQGYLNICDAMGMTPADLDLKIWLSQRGGYEVLEA